MSRASRIGVSLALLGGSTLLGCAPRRVSLEDVAAAAGPSRPVFPRLVAFPGWARCSPPRPEALSPVRCAPSRGSIAGRARLEGRLSVALERGDVAALRPAGVLRLIAATGAEDLDAAVGYLERAAEAAPADADARADLAAAYIVRAQSTASPFDLVRALEAASRALEIAPGHVVATFDHAWLLDHLALHTQAPAAWRRFLEVEPTGGWADEARSYLGRFPRPDLVGLWQQEKETLKAAALTGDDLDTARALVGDHRQRAREWLEDEVLGDWAEAAAAGERERAEEQLDIVRMVGSLLEDFDGDRLASDALAIIERVDAPSRRALVAGHRAYARGVRSIAEGRYDLAAAPLADAERLLAEGGSPFADRAAFQRLRCTYQRSDYAAVVNDGAALLARIDAERYPALAARTAWVRGTALMERGGSSEAAAAYRFAMTRFDRTEDMPNRAAARSLLGGALAAQGDQEGAWAVRHQALRLLDREPSPRHLRLLLTDMAFDAAEAGLMAAALVLQDEAVALAEAVANPLPKASAHLHRGAMRWQPGARTAAWDDLARAETYVSEIADENLRATLTANRLRLEGQILAIEDPARAVQRLNEGIALHRARGFDLQLPWILQSRALARRSLGDRTAAAVDLYEAIALLEARRDAVWSPSDRVAFLDRQTAFESLVDLLADTGEIRAALHVAERGRSRLLLDWLAHGPQDAGPGLVAPLGAAAVDAGLLEKVQAGLGAGQLTVVFEVLEDRLLAWAVTRDEVALAPLDSDRATLAAVLARALTFLEGPAPDNADALAALRDSLVAPLASWLDSATSVVIVPDEALAAVPWHALPGTEAGTFAMAELRLGVVPSLSLLARLLDRPASPDGTLVAIGDPAFDREAYPTLDPLRGAAREASALAAVWPGAVLLTGTQATKAAVLEALGTADVLWLGAHGVTDAGDPLASGVLLAPDGDDDGRLQARDLLGVPLGQLELVVLASCRGAGGARGSRESLLGLVWPLLAAGVRQVVASPVRVRDDTEAPPMTLVPGFSGVEIAPGSSYVVFGLPAAGGRREI